MPWLDEISAERDYWLGSFGPLLIQFWLGEITPKSCRGLASATLSLAARQKDGALSVLSVSLPTAVTPGLEARRALAALSRDTGKSIARVAIVREGPAFAASAVAAVAAGIQLIAGATPPRRAFTDVTEAIRWATQPLPDFATGRILVEDAADAMLRRRKLLSGYL